MFTSRHNAVSQVHTNIGAVEHLASKDRMIVMFAVAAIVVLAGIYTITGVGMKMSAFDMTGMANSIGAPMQMGQVAD